MVRMKHKNRKFPHTSQYFEAILLWTPFFNLSYKQELFILIARCGYIYDETKIVNMIY